MRNSKKNKFYVVEDIENYEGLVNIVIARTAREAKKLGSNTDATECLESWTDLRVKAVRGGQMFWKGEQGTIMVTVGGKGFLYTDKPSQVDTWWDNFFEELKKQGRYSEEVDPGLKDYVDYVEKQQSNPD